MSMLSVEECELLGDSKYRSYITQVEKALKSFEYTSEWADLISALGKLNKVLLAHLKYPVIPKKVTIGKRLAQCLHPALPSGVHLKALETYDIIFKCIGTQRLAQDLFIYGAGLFPLLGHAAMSVKPALLTLYEAHFVPLGISIKPGLNGLLLGLLPGLDEGAESFDRANGLLDDFMDAAGASFFYTSMWECVHSCPNVRLPAVNFLLSHFNKKQSMEDQLHMIGLDIDLMVDALCNALQDSSVLVQRSTLDFLQLAFPMHNGQLTRADMAKVVQAAINVVLRRDMSLNRRLFAWLLGTCCSGHLIASAMATASASNDLSPRLQRADSTSTTSELDTSYFHLFSRDLLVQALKVKLMDQSVDATSGRPASLIPPLRILISLLDKPEIGPVILESVLLTVFRALCRECLPGKAGRDVPSKEGRRNGRVPKEKTEKEEKGSVEVIKTANLLFGSFEPYYVWDFLARMFDVACENPHSRNKNLPSSKDKEVPSVTELCNIVEFLLDNVPLEVSAETQTEYLPELLRHIVSCLTQHCDRLSDLSQTAALRLCSRILAKVQPSLTLPTSEDQDNASETASLDPSTLSFGLQGKMDSILQNHLPKKKPQEERDENSNTTATKDGESVTKDGERELQREKEVKEKVGEEEKGSDDVFPPPSDDLDESGGTSGEVSSAKEESSRQETATSSRSTGGEKSAWGQGGDVGSQSASTEQFPASLRVRTVSGSESLRSFTNTPLPLMQACVQSFQEFFHAFLSQKIFQLPSVVSRCMESITLSPDPARTSDQDSAIDMGSTASVDEVWGRRSGTRVEVGKVHPESLGAEGCQAFRQACRLLVDLASFPLYCTDYHRLLEQSTGKDGDGILPLWLQDLMACCCCVSVFDIQSVAIATMLDLIILTQSVLPEDVNYQTSDRGSRSAAEGRVSVVMLPALLPRHLCHINDNTVFYQVVARELWGFLGETTPASHKRGVELFHLLHQVTPSSWICEDVIGTDLVAEELEQRIKAFKKFTVLWHLTRDLKSEHCPGRPPRCFDRSMFVVLDSLKEETGPTKTVATTWLTHVVQRSDISRVLLPLFLMMLHPDTARVSIQHVNVHTPRKVRLSEGGGEEDSAEARIYAISSEGGNVIFHVSPPGPRFSPRMAEDLKSYALTVMNEKGSAMTAPVKHQEDSELHFEKVNPENLNLRINPFGSTSSLDKLIFDGYEFPISSQVPNLDNARRLDLETCKKEGLFCETESAEPEKEEVEEEEKEETVESIVGALLEELVHKAVDLIEENPDKGEDAILASPSMMESEGSLLCDQDLLSAMEQQGGDMDSPSCSELDTSREGGIGEDETTRDIHALHMHLLLYTQQYDYRRTLYALTTLRAMLTMCPRLVVTAMSTTSISTVHPPQLARLQALLARHRKSVFGKNFFGELPSEVLSNYRGNMFLEIVISLCLYYIRSYYPNLMMSKLSQDELLGNKEVHTVAAEVLSLLMSELVSIVRESGRNFSSYIRDLLMKCKLQKALLHCILASVYNSRSRHSAEKGTKITEAIISFNEDCLPGSAVETFQVRLLNLLLIVVMLEAQMYSGQEMDAASPSTSETESHSSSHLQSPGLMMRYLLNVPVVQQGMFLSSVLSALKQQHACHLHRHWLAMVTSALPFMGRALPGTILNVVLQLCRNLESLAEDYQSGSKDRKSNWEHVPPDHLVTMLEGLTTLVHYCLLDNASPVSIGQPAPTPTSISTETASAGQILSNLIHVFNPITSSRETSPQREVALMPPVLEARRELLNRLPRIMACMATLWRAITAASVTDVPADHDKHYVMGMPKVVRQHILEFVSPISRPHGSNLLGAVAVAWNESRKKTTSSIKKLFPAPSAEQLLLVELVSAIRVLPTDTLIQTVRQVIRQPPLADLGKSKKQVPLEVNMLQFFFSYVQQTSVAQLVDSWPSLLSLMREGLQLSLSPPGQFLLLQILNEFVQKTPPMEDKKSQKDLQEISQKLLEVVAGIAGSSLEQTTWLRRNLAVKPGPQAELPDHEDGDVTEDSGHGKAERALPTPDGEAVMEERQVVEPRQSLSSDSKYSVHALHLLAELTAPLLDVVYASEEKEKVAPFLTTIMYNIFPYLRNHKTHNLPSLRACSWLLAGVSSYQYTRKAWRREAFELLMGPGFFQMDAKCLGYWCTIIDNLLTHDKTTFKDLMGRVAMNQSGSLNLFSSKEQEYEQRAHMLKRLTFAIFCSEPDQYQRSMPDIQERLAESLRLSQVPTVMAQVFFCFRVLILRMSAQHLTSLWPTIITEMVQVFLQIEQELSTETDEFKTQLQRIATLDSSWAHFGNGLNAHNNPAWLQLYLSVCKLLDQCLAMPSEAVPHFQLYRWAFIGTATGEESEPEEERRKKPQPRFVPHIVRLARLLNTRMQRDVPVLRQSPGRPLLSLTYLRSLSELQPFFNTICTPRLPDKETGSIAASERRRIPKSKSAPSFDDLTLSLLAEGASINVKSSRQYIEELVEKDFLEFLSQ